MTVEVTLKLPENLSEHAKRVGTAIQRDVRDVGAVLIGFGDAVAYCSPLLLLSLENNWKALIL